MKASSVSRLAILFGLFYFITSSNLTATQINIDPSFSIFSGTNLVILKQIDAQQKSPSNWPSYTTVAIAFMVAIIGLLQWHLAMEKFKLDLFDRRFVVYKATQKFLETALGKSRIDWHEREILRRETQDAIFLFKNDVVGYIDSLYKKTSDIEALEQKRMTLPAGPEHQALIEQEGKLRKEFNDEWFRLKDVFAPYLRFRVWKWPFI